MTIVHIREHDQFVQVDRSCIQDPRLSWKAKGLFVYLQTLDTVATVALVAEKTSSSERVIKTILKELESFGYVELGGKW